MTARYSASRPETAACDAGDNYCAHTSRIRAMLDKIMDRPEPFDEDEHDNKTKPRSRPGKKIQISLSRIVFFPAWRCFEQTAAT
jgi:hypothetical protein